MGTLTSRIFGVQKPIVGTVYFNGENSKERVSNAISEVNLFDSYGLNGVLFFNRYGNPDDLVNVLEILKGRRIVRGIDITNVSQTAIDLANFLGISFVQFDRSQLECYSKQYDELITNKPEVSIFRKVDLTASEEELYDAIKRHDVIVVSSNKEIDLKELQQFKMSLCNGSPVFVGSGVTSKNAYEHSKVADGLFVDDYIRVGGQRYLTVNKSNLAMLMSSLQHRESRNYENKPI